MLKGKLGKKLPKMSHIFAVFGVQGQGFEKAAMFTKRYVLARIHVVYVG